MCAIGLPISGLRFARSCRSRLGECTCWLSRVSAGVTGGCQPSLAAADGEKLGDRVASAGCGTPRQVVNDARHDDGLHSSEPIPMPVDADSLGTSLCCLHFSFDQLRGGEAVQALQEHRLNPWFVALTDHPDQGPGRAIRACGPGEARSAALRQVAWVREEPRRRPSGSIQSFRI